MRHVFPCITSIFYNNLARPVDTVSKFILHIISPRNASIYIYNDDTNFYESSMVVKCVFEM